MSRKEVPRPGLLKMVLAGKATNAQAATALRLSIPQVQRLKVRYQTDGAPGLAHRSRGQPSLRRLAAARRARVDELLPDPLQRFQCKRC